MGKTHAMASWCVGLVVAPPLGLTTLPAVLMFAVTAAGFSLLPDLDHPGARVSKLFGPITGGISWALRRFSGALYQVTRGRRDEKGAGTHRHASHTLLFALALGGATAWGTSTSWGRWVTLGILLLGVLLAEDALGDWAIKVSGLAALALVYVAFVAGGSDNALAAFPAALDTVGTWLWLAVAIGCFAHCLQDAWTESGCPFLAPIPICGEFWFELRPPSWLRFRTGKWFEHNIAFPAFSLLGVLLVPGVWPLAWALGEGLYTTIHTAAAKG